MRKGCLYSVLAAATLAITVLIFSEYGRACCMRSCALRILLAATICIARVIFCVFWMLRILFLTSRAPAISHYLSATRSDWP